MEQDRLAQVFHTTIFILVLPLVALGVRFASFHRLFELLNRMSPRHRSTTTDREPDERAQAMVDSLSRADHYLPIDSTCLTRSLALWYVLRWHNIDGQLRIGVNRNDGTVAAHAWIEQGGRVLNDRSDIHTRYVAFDPIDPPVARFPDRW